MNWTRLALLGMLGRPVVAIYAKLGLCSIVAVIEHRNRQL